MQDRKEQIAKSRGTKLGRNTNRELGENAHPL